MNKGMNEKMNKDLLQIIERYMIQENVAHVNMEYHKRCYLCYRESYCFLMYRTNQSSTLSFNFRELQEGRKVMNGQWIYNLHLDEVGRLSANY
jgi:hypothetical protein